MAEVKVKISAQNEIRTGLQQALSEAKSFGQEASKAMSIDSSAATNPLRGALQSQDKTIKVALEATGLESVDQLKAALDSANSKTVQLALEATGLGSAQELQAALDSANTKVVELALQATGLQSAQELRTALDSANSKQVSLALEATGLGSADELRAALDGTNDKTIALALEATGLSSADELRAALDSAENKTVELALSATGLNRAEELREAIDAVQNKRVEVTAQTSGQAQVQLLKQSVDSVENTSATIELSVEEEAALEPLRKIQQELRDIQEEAEKPIELQTQGNAAEELATTSASGASAIRGLATDLANASSAGEVFEAVLRRITTAFGGLVAASAAFAIGSIIRRTLEDAAAGLSALIDQSQSLQQSFSSLSAPTTTFDQLATAVRGASAQIEALEEANRKLQSGVGFQLADYVNSFDLSSAADRETEQGVSNARAALANAIGEATNRELQLAKARTDEERKLIALQANREQRLAEARGVSPKAEQNMQALFAAQDATTSQDRERGFEEQAAKQRAINEENKRSLEERLTREKQGLADLQQFGGAGIDARREQSIARIAELEKQITSEREKQSAQELATRQQTAGVSRSIQDFGADLATLLARAQERLALLENPNIAANMGLSANQAELERKQLLLEILSIEQQIEQAQKRDAQTLAGLERSVQTPDQRRASLEDEQAALAEQAASLAPDDFAGRAEVAAEAQRIAGELGGLGQGGGQTGSFGASSLQRIGFASDEFFDTRSKKDPADETRRAADFVKQIIDILKNGEPLVLSSSN